MTGSADLLLANSHFTADCIRQIHGREAKVAHFGVDTTAFRPLNLDKQDFILSVGSIMPHKGFDFLVEVVSLIPEVKRPELRIVCNVSDERELAHLHILAKRSRVSLKVEGPISEEELLNRYNEAALLVYTPYREPFGLAPIEAMSCGTPVVAVAEGGVRETVIHGENGFLLERDATLFAETIQALLADYQRRLHLGRRARESVVKTWSWEKSVEQVERHLLSIASSSEMPSNAYR
jgi:glycosyltransferase involved in cell wall biosynthesis